MTMWVAWPLAVMSGLIMGMLYFRFLWLTVRRLPMSAHPYRLLLLSFAVRASLAAAVFYLFLTEGSWERLCLVLAGFIGAREICKRRWGGQSPIHVNNVA